MEELKAERATTIPSSNVTVIHAGFPAASSFSILLTRLPCR